MSAAVTPYEQQENYETGHSIGRVDRQWNSYTPPRSDGTAAMDALILGYDAGWSELDRFEDCAANMADTDEEARFENDLEYLQL